MIRELLGQATSGDQFTVPITSYVLTVGEALTIATVSWAARAVQKLSRVVDVLVREVMPAGDESIRERMRTVERNQAVTQAMIAAQRPQVIVNQQPNGSPADPPSS